MTTQSSPPILASTLYRLYSHPDSTGVASTKAAKDAATDNNKLSTGKSGRSTATLDDDPFAENHIKDDGYESVAISRGAKRLRADASALRDESSPNSALGISKDSIPPQLTIGLDNIDDDVLDGGLCYGLSTSEGLRTESDGIIGLALPSNDAGCEVIPLSFIAEHLLNSKLGKVYYIDAEASAAAGKLKRLYALICERIRRRRRREKEREKIRHTGGYVYSRWESESEKEGENGSEVEEESVTKEAEGALERVEWMRVLDFEGLMEAVGEVSSILRRPLSSRSGGEGPQTRESRKVGKSGEIEAEKDADAMDITAGDTDTHTTKRMEIADSEDEDEEIIASPDPESNPKAFGNTNKEEPASTTQTQPPAPTLLLTSPLPKLITPLMKRNHVSGHALLSNFLRSLRHLVQECEGTLVVLCNSLVYPQMTSQQNARHEEPSAFMDISARPALGRTFNWALDLSLMAVRFPGRLGQRQRNDGDVMEDEDGVGEVEAERPVVLEVLHDRLSDRTGRWGLFTPENLS